ncbi:MAG: hypothetical protein L0H15_12185 [Nitrosospira sp.]|nr:hypothetical protein [Nitrosospira sp.]MDN5882332.1 hypothetical protein [Nitrosospira sp.]MDN5936297.1 hypothetical protein [Nitrosospira sp.]
MTPIFNHIGFIGRMEDSWKNPTIGLSTSLLRTGGYMAAGKEAFEWLLGVIKDWL